MRDTSSICGTFESLSGESKSTLAAIALSAAFFAPTTAISPLSFRSPPKPLMSRCADMGVSYQKYSGNKKTAAWSEPLETNLLCGKPLKFPLCFPVNPITNTNLENIHLADRAFDAPCYLIPFVGVKNGDSGGGFDESNNDVALASSVLMAVRDRNLNVGVTIKGKFARVFGFVGLVNRNTCARFPLDLRLYFSLSTQSKTFSLLLR